MSDGDRGSGAPRRVHLVGIGGMHMSAIAQILLSDGVQVSGSDLHDSDLIRRLAATGARVARGHAAENVGDADLVVTTAAAKSDNPELMEARRRGIPVIARAEMVARLMAGRTSVAVAGTHGKTTTSSLVAFLLAEAGLSPAYLLGGESLDLGGNAAPGAGRHIVVEADEYARAFLEYRPDLAIITNLEPDHLDYYGTVAALVDAFRQFLGRIPAHGRIIACADSPMLLALLRERTPAPVELYRVAAEAGAVAPAGWTALDAGANELGGHDFTLLRDGAPLGRFQTMRPGLHNVANATAALAAGMTLGLPVETMAAALRRFRGARRRFEPVGEAGDVTVIDDYAHHPTEVRATLAAARERFPGRRVVTLFQPHTYSRSAYLLDDFRECFGGTDVLYVLETFAARETAEAGLAAADLARQVRRPTARYVGTREEAVRLLAAEVRPHDVIFTMGAGDVTTVGPTLLARLAGAPVTNST